MKRASTWVAAPAMLAMLIAAPHLARAREYTVARQHAESGDENPGTAGKPLKTISKAASVVQPGDTILVKGGTYRERVTFKTSGKPEQRITLKAAPGERVVINGASPITGWRKVTREEVRGNVNFPKIYCAEVADGPRALFQGGRRLKVSRWPVEGRLPTEGGRNNSVVDAKHLTQPAGYWEGGTLVVRVDKIGSYRRSIITSYDVKKHELVTEKPRKKPTVPVKDVYWIENAVAAIDAPGEYVVDERSKPAKVYLWPLDAADPDVARIETPGRGAYLLTWADGVGYLTIDGLEVAFGPRNGIGSGAKDGHDIEIVNCISHHHARGAFAFHKQSKITVRRSIGAHSQYGIMFSGVAGCEVTENFLLSNGEDGLVVSWKSENVRIVRNCIVDHWWDSHPDGFQIYRGVKNMTVDSNLIFNSGQGFMSEQGDVGKWINNMIVGTHQTGLSFGHYSVHNYEMTGNTLAYTGFRTMTFSGKNTKMRNNVFITGGDGLLIRKGGKEPFDSDYNLFWAPEGTKRLQGEGPHSKYGDPKFRSAPPLGRRSCFIIDQWGNKANLAKNTSGKFYLAGRPLTASFSVGDHVEVNYDGRVRKITEATDEYVAFDPPLPMLHHFKWDVLVNWKDRTDFVWDLRLSDDSPGKGMGENGADVGSNIDIQAYLKGDFNGDGRRDLPPVPDDVLQP